VAGRADLILTWNRKDFPAGPIGDLGVRVTDPDKYLKEIRSEVPAEVVATVIRLAADRRRPFSALDLAGILARAGVPGFAADLAARLDPSPTT
jgi:hypothetical protein